MKIVVLNGSPKGDVSVTMQYINYMKLKYAAHEFKVVNIAQTIDKIQKNDELYNSIIQEIIESDVVLWAFPLYVCLVHSNYKRFIEMIWEKNSSYAFKNKYTAVLSTSVHFFDHTAHNYMHAICDDLDMKYIGFYSAEMHDLLKIDGRKSLEIFTENIFDSITNKIALPKHYRPLDFSIPVYTSKTTFNKINQINMKILVIIDSKDTSSNLSKMVNTFHNYFEKSIEIIDLEKISMKGSCLGCLQCGFDNHCIYGDSDDLFKIYNDKIKNADIIVFASYIKDRFLSSRFKTFIDRRFVNTHQPQMVNKQIGYIISGPLSQLSNTTEVIQAIAELDQSNLLDIVTDEYDNSVDIDHILYGFAQRLVTMAEKKYVRPSTFLGVGGMRIFRDEIWGHLRFVFQADHRYYKKHGIYNFPQKDIKTRLTNLFMILFTKVPPVKDYMQKNMKQLMLSPYKKVLDDNSK